MTYEGNCRLGDLFTSRREKGRPGLPTLSVTLNDGLVNREDLDRKQETNLAPEEHLLVKPGDIAYNMMRMWQGAFGLASNEGMVSPAYVVLKPTERIDSQYAAYLLGSPRLLYLLWAYSYGITDDRLRLYFADFAKIPANVPPINVQRKIAATISSWNEAIERTESLLAAFENQRKGLVKALVGGQFSSGTASQNWQKTKLADVAKVIVSNVDKKEVVGELPIALCNYVHVYYNRQIKREITFDKGTATSAELKKFQLRKHDIVITKDSEEAEDIGVASYIVPDCNPLKPLSGGARARFWRGEDFLDEASSRAF